MLYRMNAALRATTAPPRVVDAHGLLHLKATAAAKACDAADAVDGLVIVQNPTLRVSAVAYGVSVGSVARAHRLSPEEREQVRCGKRPLVYPTVSLKPVPTAVMSIVPDLRERLFAIVNELGGVDETLNMLATASSELVT